MDGASVDELHTCVTGINHAGIHHNSSEVCEFGGRSHSDDFQSSFGRVVGNEGESVTFNLQFLLGVIEISVGLVVILITVIFVTFLHNVVEVLVADIVNSLILVSPALISLGPGVE